MCYPKYSFCVSFVIKNALLLSFALLFTNCGDDTTSPPTVYEKNGECSNIESLFQVAKFPIGTALNYDAFLSDVAYRNLVETHYNSITPENVMKPSNIHPLESEFNWGASDSIIQFCSKHAKHVHGHTLVWHNQLPDWILNYKGTKKDWEDVLKNHIQTIVLRYKGKIRGWDVVNEAFEEDGSLRNTIWLENIGESYIEKAFMYAHNADPSALLFYNDFNLESNATKREKVIQFLNTAKNRGATIHGIGLQMHIYHLYPSELMLKETFEEVVSNNYKVHISEMDVSVNPMSVDIVPDSTLLAQQAKQYETVIRLYSQLSADKKYGCTLWGVTDKYSWIRSFFYREDYPLLFDDNYKQKPAFFSMKKALCIY